MEGKIFSCSHSFGKAFFFFLLLCVCVESLTHNMSFQVLIRFLKKVPANEIAQLVMYWPEDVRHFLNLTVECGLLLINVDNVRLLR